MVDRACKTPNLEISIVSESIPHLKRGALRDFLKIMKWTGRWNRDHYNKTDMIYTFANGSYIEFFSADQDDKLRGARRDILYINEANNITQGAYDQLRIRTRKEVWIDFNPSNEFWAHEELSDDPDTEWLTLTYKDNDALEESIINEIEKAMHKGFYDSSLEDESLFAESNIKSRYWSNWWKVYGLGQLGILEGVIFSDWSIVENLPVDASYLGSGIDFGYTNDPTTIIDFYNYNNQIIWDEQTYERGLKNHQIAKRLKGQKKTEDSRIVADSAEPKSIDEINEYGFQIVGAEKGKDSIIFGIDLIQQNPFLVTASSTHTIKELRNYCWDTDKHGKKLNTPVDDWNHTIDPARYFYTKHLSMSKKNNGQVDEQLYNDLF